ncbi:Uncharacterised protein [Mycobacteroides abscessus subsp. abscessus]|nr:Uncharacterised protein [Mycobacteroides abscessus subsp. abscessus]
MTAESRTAPGLSSRTSSSTRARETVLMAASMAAKAPPRPTSAIAASSSPMPDILKTNVLRARRSSLVEVARLVEQTAISVQLRLLLVPVLQQLVLQREHLALFLGFGVVVTE